MTPPHELVKQPDGTSVLVIERGDALDVYVSQGNGAQIVGLEVETAWALGRVFLRHWVRNWFGLKLWWWRRSRLPRVTP